MHTSILPVRDIKNEQSIKTHERQSRAKRTTLGDLGLTYLNSNTILHARDIKKNEQSNKSHERQRRAEATTPRDFDLC